MSEASSAHGKGALTHSMDELQKIYGVGVDDLPKELIPFADSVLRLVQPLYSSVLQLHNRVQQLVDHLQAGHGGTADGAPAHGGGDFGALELTVSRAVEALGPLSRENINRLKAILAAGENASRSQIEKHMRGGKFEWRGFQTAITRRFRVVLRSPNLEFFSWSTAANDSDSRLRLGPKLRAVLEQAVPAYESGEFSEIRLHRRGPLSAGQGVSADSLAAPVQQSELPGVPAAEVGAGKSRKSAGGKQQPAAAKKKSPVR